VALYPDLPLGDRNSSIPLLFDTDTMPPSERLHRFRHEVGRAVVPVEIEHHTGPEAVRARCVGRNVGRLSVLTVKSTPVTLRRTKALVRADHDPYVVLELQRAGRRTVTQDDRSTVLHPGDLDIIDASRPYTSANLDGTNQHCIRVPRADLALPERTLSGITGLRVGPENPVAELMASYLVRLAGDDRLAAWSDLDVFESPTIELMRAVVATQLGDAALAREPLENTLALRIMEFTRQHLTDHDLGAAKIARAHNISVRHLYTTLSRSGIGLGEWIRLRRLEGCRGDLARTGRTSQTISFIAHRWGFGDATHFSRTFRDAFGMSPREWRALHQ
jgi:AraC-like DNA-binding protein